MAGSDGAVAAWLAGMPAWALPGMHGAPAYYLVDSSIGRGLGHDARHGWKARYSIRMPRWLATISNADVEFGDNFYN